MSDKIYHAAMIIIGNEILSGRTQDVNLNYLAKALNELGVRLSEARVIPDVEDVIVDTVNELRAKYDYVFTTGGIGPTHDDITAVCIAKAFDVPIVMNPEIEAVIRSREAPPEVMEMRLLMARTPEGASLIDNKTGDPQNFQMGNMFVMAGVPLVMQAMVDSLDNVRLPGGKPVRSVTVGAFLGESQVARQLAQVQARYPDIDLGSYPFYRKEGYGTNLVMRGTELETLEAMKEELRQVIEAMGEKAHDGGV